MKEKDIPTQDLQADLSQLVNVGKLEEDFKIKGFVFRIRTLTAKENTECLAALSHIGDLSKITELRDHVLSRAIISIQGKPLEALYVGPEVVEDSGVERKVEIHERRLAVVESWQTALIGLIWTKYENLRDRSEAFFDDENKSATEKSLGN